jgi:hypothetical protein
MSSSNRRELAGKSVCAVFADAGQSMRAIFDRGRSRADNGNFVKQNRSVRKHCFSPLNSKRDACQKHTGNAGPLQLSFLIVFQFRWTEGASTT